MQFLIDNMQAILISVTALLSAVIGILLIIPGEQGETFLARIRDFLLQFIKKS